MFEEIYNNYVNGNITMYKKQLNRLSKRHLIEYGFYLDARIDSSLILLHFYTYLDK